MAGLEVEHGSLGRIKLTRPSEGETLILSRSEAARLAPVLERMVKEPWYHCGQPMSSLGPGHVECETCGFYKDYC